MKNLIPALTFAILALFPAPAEAALSFDGCYQMYLPSTMYPAFCLDGTAEEGINGSGARLVIFGTNSSNVAHCSVSTSSVLWVNSYAFEIDGVTELKLENAYADYRGRVSGDVVTGRTRLKFMQLDGTTAQRLMGIARSSRACIDAGW